VHEPRQFPRRSAIPFRGAGFPSAPGCSGFSLIELLVTLALILILTTMFWGFNSSSHQRTQMKLCQQNLQKIFVSLEIYANDFAGKFPAVTNAANSEPALAVLVPRYSADTAIFICPGSKDSPLPAGESFRDRKISYAYYQGRFATNTAEALMSDRQINSEARSAGDEVFSTTGKPPGNNHSKFGGNFLFCDGHLESTPPRVPFSITQTPGVVLLNPRPQ